MLPLNYDITYSKNHHLEDNYSMLDRIINEFGSLLNIFNFRSIDELLSTTINKTDSEALFSDFEEIGQDMKIVMDDFLVNTDPQIKQSIINKLNKIDFEDERIFRDNERIINASIKETIDALNSEIDINKVIKETIDATKGFSHLYKTKGSK